MPSRYTPFWFSCFSYAGGCGFFPVFLPVPPFTPVAPAFGLDACHATWRMVPRVLPSRASLRFIGPGFLTTTGSSDSLQRLGRYSMYSRLARLYGCATRSPSITLEDFPSVPAIQTLSGLALAFGLALSGRRALRTRPPWLLHVPVRGLTSGPLHPTSR